MANKNTYIWELFEDTKTTKISKNIKNKIINSHNNAIKKLLTTNKKIKFPQYNIVSDENIYLSEQIKNNIILINKSNMVSSIEYYNKYIYDLPKVGWIDASNLTSLRRDEYNNIYKILDKSGNNNYFIQPDSYNQPKYHNGSIILNNIHELHSSFTFEYIHIFIICKERGLNPTYPYGVYEITKENTLQFINILLNNTLSIGSNFNGEIYEMLIFNIELEKKDKIMIEKYLLNKWDTVKNPSIISILNTYLWLDTSEYIDQISNNTFEIDNNVLNYSVPINLETNFTIFIVINNEQILNLIDFLCNIIDYSLESFIYFNNSDYKLYEFTIVNDKVTFYVNGKIINTNMIVNKVNALKINAYINEFVLINDTISITTKKKLYNFFSEKWNIDLSNIFTNDAVSYINQYIPRLKIKNQKYLPLNVLFSDESNITISDTSNLSKNLNIQIPMPVSEKFSNQLTIIDDDIYLSVIDFGVIYNVNQYINNGIIHIPNISENNIFAFKNIGNFVFIIQNNNKKYNIEKTSDIHYFIYRQNEYTYVKNIDIESNNHLDITLNKYDNVLNNSFTINLNGWLNSYNKFELLFTNRNNMNTYSIQTDLIYFDTYYKTDFNVLVAVGTYSVTIKELNYTLQNSIIINESVYADIEEYSNNIYTIELKNWCDTYKTIKKLDIFVSNNKNYSNSVYVLTCDILEDNICNFNFNFIYGFNWITVKDQNNIIHINILDPIVINNNFKFTLLNPTFNINEYIFLLKDWKDSNTLTTIDVYANDKLINTINTSTIIDNIVKVTLKKRLQFMQDTVFSILNKTVINIIPKIQIKCIINKLYGFIHTNNVFTVKLLFSNIYDLLSYSDKWYVFVSNNIDNDFELITNIQLINNTFTFIYNPLENTENKYFFISNNDSYSDIQIPLEYVLDAVETAKQEPITFNILSFIVMNNNENSYTIKLINWTSNIHIYRLYIIDTNSNELLTETSEVYQNDENEYFVDFTYIFSQVQNYISICDVDNMSGDINYIIDTPIIYRPKLDYNTSVNNKL